MKIGIIGAGVSGLVSAKYCLEYGHEIVIFEHGDNFGGTWRYTDKVGLDEYGVPIYSAMYKHLKTNLPKEIMLLRGLDHKNVQESYVSQPFVLEYLERYVDKFNILPKIKFRHHVKRVHPQENGKWLVTFTDVVKKSEEEITFDALMVCNGHYYKRKFPEIPGMREYTGTHLHSRDYRVPDIFENKTVVVIGAGPSGVDIAKHSATKAKLVYVSKKANSSWQIPTAANIVVKPEVESFAGCGCRFKDGTYEDVDVAVYCTGYEYAFPFLSEDSGITVEDNHVKHLYRHLINIQHPTMAVVGLLFGISVFPIVDLSVRYFLTYLDGKFKLPGKEEMIQDELKEQRIREALGWPQRYSHKSPDHGQKLLDEMAAEAHLEKIPRVLFDLHKYISKNRSTDLCFRVLDDETYVQVACHDAEL